MSELFKESAKKGISNTHKKAKSTQDGASSALSKFNEFLSNNLEVKKSALELTEKEICSFDLFDRFAEFLTEDLIDNKKGELDHMKCGSALTYFSHAKNFAVKQFPSNDIWKSEKWYSAQRSLIERKITRRCMERGIPVSEKAPPLGRKLTARINEEFFKQSM